MHQNQPDPKYLLLSEHVYSYNGHSEMMSFTLDVTISLSRIFIFTHSLPKKQKFHDKVRIKTPVSFMHSFIIYFYDLYLLTFDPSCFLSYTLDWAYMPICLYTYTYIIGQVLHMREHIWGFSFWYCAALFNIINSKSFYYPIKICEYFIIQN